MTSIRTVALVAFSMFSIAAALADPIPGPDPVIRSGGGSGSVPITSSTFTIGTASGSSPTDGTPCLLLVGGNSTPAPGCFFLNQIGTSADTIRVMVFIADQNFSGVLTCALTTALGGPSPWFTQCGASGDKVTFFGGQESHSGRIFRSGSAVSTIMPLSASKLLTRTFPNLGRWSCWVALLCWFAGGCASLKSREPLHSRA